MPGVASRYKQSKRVRTLRRRDRYPQWVAQPKATKLACATDELVPRGGAFLLTSVLPGHRRLSASQ